MTIDLARRAFIKGAPVAAAALAAPAITAATPFETQQQKCLRLLAELRHEMLKLPANESDGSLTYFARSEHDNSRLTLGINGDGEDIFIGFLPSNHTPADLPVVDLYDGPGVYEVKVTRNGKTYRPTYYLERIPYRTRPGFYYAASMRWKGKVQSNQRYRADQIKIVSKLTGHAAEIRS